MMAILVILLKLLELCMLIALGSVILYLVLLSICALLSRRMHGPFKTKQYRRFAVVVPAHNEELAIGRTLDSLFALDYPQNYFDVIVIADNCTDATATLARERGAVVYERTNTTLRGKGFALRWCFDQLLSKKYVYEAVVVIDADSVASSNFLTVMNYYLERGAQAIQSSDMVSPRPGAWSSEITRLGFTLYNYVRPLGRKLLNASAGLRGNGMCFSSLTLRTVPWDAYTVAEDLEYGLQLLLHEIPVVFAPEAQVLATMPEHAVNAETQRTRWEKGRIPVIRRHAWPLLVSAASRMSFKSFDALIDLVIPPFVNLVAAVVLLFLLTVAAAYAGVAELWPYAIAWIVIIVLSILHVLIGLLSTKADRRLYLALLYIPRYAVWKFMLKLKVFRHSPTKWIRTTRERQMVPPLAEDQHRL